MQGCCSIVDAMHCMLYAGTECMFIHKRISLTHATTAGARLDAQGGKSQRSDPVGGCLPGHQKGGQGRCARVCRLSRQVERGGGLVFS